MQRNQSGSIHHNQNPAQQSQSVFNPNVNNLESHSPPKSPENGGVLNANDPHRFSYGNKGQNGQQQQNNGYNNNQNNHRNPNGSFSNRNNNLQSQPPRNQYGHSPQNSGQHQFNGNNMNQNNQQNNYQSPQRNKWNQPPNKPNLPSPQQLSKSRTGPHQKQNNNLNQPLKKAPTRSMDLSANFGGFGGMQGVPGLQAAGGIRVKTKESVYMDMTIAEVERMQAQQGGNNKMNIPTANLDKNKTVRQILEEQKAMNSQKSQANAILAALNKADQNPPSNPWGGGSSAWNKATTNTNNNQGQQNNNNMGQNKGNNNGYNQQNNMKPQMNRMNAQNSAPQQQRNNNMGPGGNNNNNTGNFSRNNSAMAPGQNQNNNRMGPGGNNNNMGQNQNNRNNQQNNNNNRGPGNNNGQQQGGNVPPPPNQSHKPPYAQNPGGRNRAFSDESSNAGGAPHQPQKKNYNNPRPFQQQQQQFNRNGPGGNNNNNQQNNRNNNMGPGGNNNNNRGPGGNNNPNNKRNNNRPPPYGNNNRGPPKAFQAMAGFQPAAAGGLQAKNVGAKMGPKGLQHREVKQPSQNPWQNGQNPNQQRGPGGSASMGNKNMGSANSGRPGPGGNFRPPPPNGGAFQPKYQGQKYQHNFRDKSYNKKEARQKQQQRKNKGSQYPPPEKLAMMDGTQYDSDESVFVTQADLARRHSWGSSSLEPNANHHPFGKPIHINDYENNKHQGLKQKKGTNVAFDNHSEASKFRPENEKSEAELVKSLELTEKEFYKKYWIEDGQLGKGSFAKVRKVTRKKDKQIFALKMIKKAGKSKEDLDALQREIAILAKIDHPNVVKLLDWCETKKRIYMVVQFCDGGDVFERILKQKTFSEKEAAHVVRKVSEGLLHVHENKIIHRDLKPDNLMYLTKDENSNIMIIDFGLAGDATNGPLSTPCGTAHYVAPEVLSSKPYNAKADMWSLGVIIYMLLCGFPPFFDAQGNQKRLYKLIKLGKYRFPSPYWDYVSEGAKDLIKNLLQLDPSKRYSAKQVLKHKWVNKSAEIEEIDLGKMYMEQMEHFSSSRQFVDAGLKLHQPGAARIGGVAPGSVQNKPQQAPNPLNQQHHNQQHQPQQSSQPGGANGPDSGKFSYFAHQQHAPKWDEDDDW
eukprot:CAMPEP_0201593262 /NCGR_PEP_ID=MMETSP0190_2-20130828/190925_1 /ASSEMBLY_ACC=CAM_ASM_000263 /TAXON_ID=37353 /ORGANISM="Rosalina sp." /LENGTH=1132 /DNA_ID=CAMNT_0048052393 /DNA_START=23 /DNA_END=3421 /DNA_ORIENTATION=-